MEDRYLPAAICRRGHVVTTDATSALTTPRCATCGAEVLQACPNCGQMIRGYYLVPGVISSGSDYEAPDFCADCGAPFPWASRQARIYELLNLLDSEELDPASALTVREQLEALANPDIDEEDERRAWERVRRLAPEFWDKSGARTILESVVSAAIKAQLGL